MLRIDLLPPGIRTRRLHKLLVALVVAILIAETGVLFAMFRGIRAERREAEETLAEVKPIADQVRSIDSDISAREAELQPIADKIEFVDEADASGEQYWDRFHAINAYIYERAQVTSFSIQEPDSVSFNVILGDTTEAARFVLNLMMCPVIHNLSISGLPAGVSIAGAAPGVATPGFTPMGPEDDMMYDEMDMAPGAPRAPTVAPGVDEISLSVSASLIEPVRRPVPDEAPDPRMPGMEFDEFDDPMMEMEPEMME